MCASARRYLRIGRTGGLLSTRSRRILSNSSIDEARGPRHRDRHHALCGRLDLKSLTMAAVSPIEWNENEQRYNWELVFCRLYQAASTRTTPAKTTGFTWSQRSRYLRDAVFLGVHGRHRYPWRLQYNLHFEKAKTRPAPRGYTKRRRTRKSGTTIAGPDLGSRRISTSLLIIIWIRSSGRRLSTATSSLC